MLACALPACTNQRDSQLTNINKDWNKLIRASHVYPIYPLTQDLQPGDIFLVNKDIEDLTDWEKDNGYLKLDHLIGRLKPEHYKEFYETTFGYTNVLPNYWLRDNSWSNAPCAAFPSYTFSVQQGVGANVSLPIQGIPVGLSLMGAKSASGYVTLSGAYTYGLDELSLQSELEGFVRSNGTMLAQFFENPNDKKETNYLQIVSRVYAVSHVSVSMLNDSAASGSFWGGAPKDVSLPTLISSNAVANYSNLLNTVNGAIPGANAVLNLAPGGSLKFTSVTQRSVSMDEDFPKPIVIGYIGFSVPITIMNTSAVTRLYRQSIQATMKDIRAQNRKKKS